MEQDQPSIFNTKYPHPSDACPNAICLHSRTSFATWLPSIMLIMDWTHVEIIDLVR